MLGNTTDYNVAVDGCGRYVRGQYRRNTLKPRKFYYSQDVPLSSVPKYTKFITKKDLVKLMTDAKYVTVRLSIEGDKFEILVKPDPALEYKTGKRTDFSNILVSDEIYSDANKGSRASSEKLSKHFKTKDTSEIAKQILSRGELSLTTDQRRRMVEEKRKQIVQFISKNFVDPKTHIPHPPVRIESALNDVRVTIDPFRRAEDQAKQVIDALRKILPLKSEVSVLTITIPPQYAAQSYSVLKTTGSFRNEQWLSDGSLRVVVEVNAGTKGALLDRIGSATRGSAQITEA